MTAKKTKRVSKVLFKKRVAEIARILLDGAVGIDVEDFIAEKEKESESLWFIPEGQQGIGYSQRMRMIQRAETLIGEMCQGDDKIKALQRHLAMRRRLYAAAVAQGDVKAALACADSEAKLLKLFPREEAKPAPANDGRMILNVVETMIVNNPPAPALAGPANPLQLTEEVTCHVPGNNGIPVAAEVREIAPGAA